MNIFEFFKFSFNKKNVIDSFAPVGFILSFSIIISIGLTKNFNIGIIISISIILLTLICIIMEVLFQYCIHRIRKVVYDKCQENKYTESIIAKKLVIAVLNSDNYDITTWELNGLRRKLKKDEINLQQFEDILETMIKKISNE